MTSATEWQGMVGDVWAAEWQRTDRSFAELAAVLDVAIRTAAPDGAGQAFDIGCGAGTTSLALAAARPALAVTGLDVSNELIAVARERAAQAGADNAAFAIADLNAALPALPPADLLVSRHGLMFADDPIAMFRHLHNLARPDAPLVFSCFRAAAENPWAGALAATITGAAPPRATANYAPGPFGFADPAFVMAALVAGGWRAVTHRPVDYAYVAGTGHDPVGDAASFFSRIGPVASALRQSHEPTDTLQTRLNAALERRLENGRVAFPAAAWLWSARA